MKKSINKHHWSPYPPMQRAIESRISPDSLVVEIGPGYIPFSLASEFIDWQTSPSLVGKKVHTLDLNQESLPYEDKSIDFIYCRHVLEDIYNPGWVCQEMSRVAKAGYIETPSPIAECCRGIDGGESPFWRGYIHHRYLTWVENGNLLFLPKYPIIEYLDFGDMEDQIIDLLNTSPMYWNTHFFWEGSINYSYLQHDDDFKVQIDYSEVIGRALETSALNSLDVALNFGINLEPKET